MKGPGILTMMMLMTLLVGAYSAMAPRASAREGTSLFSHNVSKFSCPLGSHYSSFYGECTRTFSHVSHLTN